MNLFQRAAFLSAVVLFTWVPVPTQGAEATAGDKKALPSAREVLERYGKAIGGKEAFSRHKSQHAIGTMEMPAQGMKGKMEVFAARPNRLLMKMTIEGIGEFNTGFDGKVAWMNSALTGPMLLEGKMGEEIAIQADFDHTLHDPADYQSIEVLGLENFNGEECYKLKLVHRTGFESTEFFSVKTGLQKGFLATQQTPLGPVTATTLVTDYKQFGDLFLPSRISQQATGVNTVMTISEMRYDNVPDSVFALPEAVKTLAGAGSETPKTSQPERK